MTITKEQMQEEAERRLKVMEGMGMHPNVLKDFKAGRLNYSEHSNVFGMPVGMLLWTEENETISKIIKDFEENSNYLVYHATHEYTDFGEILDIFYVSTFEDEWGYEFEENGDSSFQASVKACNVTVPEYSDMGTIGVEITGGGAVRVW